MLTVIHLVFATPGHLVFRFTTAEHYPIVGRNLLASIEEVLGKEVATKVSLLESRHRKLRGSNDHFFSARLLACITRPFKPSDQQQVIDGWAEAYTFLADVLIKREKEIYDEIAARPGGWNGKRQFEVVEKIQKSPLVASIVMKVCTSRKTASDWVADLSLASLSLSSSL